MKNMIFCLKIITKFILFYFFIHIFMNKFKFFKYIVWTGIFLSSIVLWISSANASCTLSSVSAPGNSEFVNGNSYQVTFATTEGLWGTCANDAAQFEAWYIYDGDGGWFTNDVWQSIWTVSPGGEAVSYARSWNTTALTDGANTRYKVRVTCANAACSWGPVYPQYH